ncbi:SprT-like [uncultured Caudovirales phage]|uniref:SprT-like n=1 Tax=uncultured Caudovirales phage TaxID=2100421 RepID=A0A6J5KMX0_9CAUD|nr:SprT-like [uncultured Caudovirales phage]
MKLTPEIVRNLYASLYCCYPYTKWDMPLPEEIDFQIIHDKETMGTYLYDTGEEYEHSITISSARCDHFYTVLTTLSHECIHMSFFRQKGDKWSQHGKEFRRRCEMVAMELGFDPKEL